MLYLNKDFVKLIGTMATHLTLTSVVFEYQILQILLVIYTYLTLTSVVFEYL